MEETFFFKPIYQLFINPGAVVELVSGISLKPADPLLLLLAGASPGPPAAPHQPADAGHPSHPPQPGSPQV